MKRLLKKTSFLTLISVCLIFTSCVSLKNIQSQEEENHFYPEQSYIAQSYDWTPVADGITYAFYSSDQNKIRYHLVKLDLEEAKLEITSYPDEKTKMDGQVFKAKKTRNFAKENSCIIAFNATQFEHAGLFSVKLKGKMKTPQKDFSSSIGKYSALAFKDSRAYIIRSQNEAECSEYDWVFGGFFTILADGKEQPFKVWSYDSRTAVGITEDCGVIYILCAEGEDKNKSIGLSYQMCAKIFKSLGCTQAIEMDGGSSTDLVINGSSVLPYKPKVSQANSVGFRKLSE